jgi:hypothetical protein
LLVNRKGERDDEEEGDGDREILFREDGGR